MSKTVKVVVDLNGGVVSQVFIEPGLDIVLDVVFLAQEDDVDLSEAQSYISGPGSQVIYTTEKSVEAKPEFIEAVFKAADQYRREPLNNEEITRPPLLYAIGILEDAGRYAMLYGPTSSVNDMLNINPMDVKAQILRFSKKDQIEIMYTRDPHNATWVQC